jgi:seryl-tRNA synthetase
MFKGFCTLDTVYLMFSTLKKLLNSIRVFKCSFKFILGCRFRKIYIIYKRSSIKIKALKFFLKKLNLILLKNYEFIPNTVSSFLLKNIVATKVIRISYKNSKVCMLPNKIKYVPHYESKFFNRIVFCDKSTVSFEKKYFVYKDNAVQYIRSLISFFLIEAKCNNYEEFIVPLLVKPTAAYNTGQLPDKDSQMFYVIKDNLFLIPTSEVPLANLYRDQCLYLKKIKLCSYSTCFRREVGS